MSQQPDEEQVIRRYLLGELSEEQEAGVEERLFSDNKFFERCLLVESSLQDEYASGELPEPVARRVEALFRSSALQRREFEFNTRLVTAVREESGPIQNRKTVTEEKRSRGSRSMPPDRVSPAWRWAPLMAACVILSVALASTIYLLLANNRLRNQVSQLDVDKQRLEERNREIEDELARERSRRPEPGNSNSGPEPRNDSALTELASITLMPDRALRSSGPALQRITLGPAVKRLRIQFDSSLKEVYSKYRVSIRTFDGKGVLSQEVSS